MSFILNSSDFLISLATRGTLNGSDIPQSADFYLAIISYFCLKGLGNNIHSRIVFQLEIIFLLVLLIGNTLTTNSFQEQSFLDNKKQESEAEVEKNQLH
jgi:hypothetical protein